MEAFGVLAVLIEKQMELKGCFMRKKLLACFSMLLLPVWGDVVFPEVKDIPKALKMPLNA